MIERSIVTPYTTGKMDKQKRSEGFRIFLLCSFAHACTHLRNLPEYGLLARKWEWLVSAAKWLQKQLILEGRFLSTELAKRIKSPWSQRVRKMARKDPIHLYP